MSQTTKPSLKVWLATILTSVPLFLFGFIGLGYENLASRVFFSYYTESSQSLSLVLAIFLVGLAVGSMLYARFSSFVSRSVVFIGLQILAATYMYVALSKFGLVNKIVIVG